MDKLPFLPEELDKLQARYADAFLFTYVIAIGMVDVPGKHRENVFDGTDGIRLIISQEQAPFGEIIHVSASHDPVLFTKNLKTMDEYLKVMTDKFVAVSGDTRELKFVGLTGKSGVPHWMIKLGK